MILIHSDFTDEQKAQLWENTLNHMTGDHARGILTQWTVRRGI